MGLTFYERRMQKAGPRQCRDVMRRSTDKSKMDIYNDARWKRIRQQAMMTWPVCPDPFCAHPDRVVESKEVHHIVPLERDDSQAFVWDNVIALCRSCHAKADALDRADHVTQVMKMKVAREGSKTVDLRPSEILR